LFEEEHFASNFAGQATQAFKILSNYSEATEGTTIQARFVLGNTKSCFVDKHTPVEQDKASLGCRQAATLLEAQQEVVSAH